LDVILCCFTAAGGLSDQDLGIVIGTSIGVTCIIICTCIIVLRNRWACLSTGHQHFRLDL